MANDKGQNGIKTSTVNRLRSAAWNFKDMRMTIPVGLKGKILVKVFYG